MKLGSGLCKSCCPCCVPVPATADDLTAHVPAGSVDVATMIFVLSAVAPEAMPRALRRVAATLRPGAQLLFRWARCGAVAA